MTCGIVRAAAGTAARVVVCFAAIAGGAGPAAALDLPPFDGWPYSPEAVILARGSTPERFQFVVLPNILNYADALRYVSGPAADFCQRSGVATGPVTISTYSRYAPQRLDGWLFEGRCD